MRASDADRESVAERLRQAATEGRLATEELEQRLEAALSARTYSELDMVVADLPRPQRSRLAVRRESYEPGWLPSALALAIAMPIALAVVAAVVLAVTGVLAMWWLWLAVGWWFFGHGRRRAYGARFGNSWHGCGGWHRGRGSAQASRGFWA